MGQAPAGHIGLGPRHTYKPDMAPGTIAGG
jgi:hypothetical protein